MGQMLAAEGEQRGRERKTVQRLSAMRECWVKEERPLDKQRDDNALYTGYFIGEFGDLPADQITKPVLNTFVDLLERCPRNVPHAIRRASLAERIAWGEKPANLKQPRLARRTVNAKGLSSISAALMMMEKPGPIAVNSCSKMGLKITAADVVKRESYSLGDLRRYQFHFASLGASSSRMNLAGTALRFFHTTLDRPGFGDRMARIPTPERLPVVLSPEEVALLLAHAPNLKYRAALSVAYGCGLLISEIANLKVTDIDSARMLIRIEQGKGRKDRTVMLSPDLLDILRRWWLVKRPRGWLFPGQQPAHPITTRQFDRACHAAAMAARLDKRVSMHTLRHSLATHLLEKNTDIRHSGLFATGQCKANVARVRSLLGPAQASTGAEPEPASDAGAAAPACPCCGGRLVIIQRFRRGEAPRARPTAIRIDTS